MRVFLDTNVLVSAVATRGLCADVLHACLTHHHLVVGVTVLEELRSVLGKKLGVPEELIGEMEAFLRREGEVVDQAPPLTLELADPADAPVLAEAVAGKAEVFVTGDAELVALGPEAPVPTLTPRQFWERLRSEEVR